jgi:hypothetical protein
MNPYEQMMKRRGMSPMRIQPQQNVYSPPQQKSDSGSSSMSMDPSMIKQFTGKGGSSGSSSGSSSLGGWGGTLAAIGALEVARPHIKKTMKKWGGQGEKTGNLGVRGSQGAILGSKIGGGWGALIGALGGAETGYYENTTGQSIGSGKSWKDFGKAIGTGRSPGMMAEKDRHKPWKEYLYAPQMIAFNEPRKLYKKWF